MPTKRLDKDKEEFFAKLSDLDDSSVKKVLWTPALYGRGSSTMRKHIEAAIDPETRSANAPTNAQRKSTRLGS